MFKKIRPLFFIALSITSLFCGSLAAKKSEKKSKGVVKKLTGVHTAAMLNQHIKRSLKKIVVLKLHNEDVSGKDDLDTLMQPVDKRIAKERAGDIDFISIDIDDVESLDDTLNPNAASEPLYLFFRAGKGHGVDKKASFLARQEHDESEVKAGKGDKQGFFENGKASFKKFSAFIDQQIPKLA